MNEQQKLFKLCQQFIEDQSIHCAETIYQSDRVIQNAYEFIEKICDIVGYLPSDDEDDNERIKELVKQSGGHFSTHNLMSNPVQHRESIELWDKNIEKFTELIVRECLGVVKNNIYRPCGDHDYSYSDENYAADIRAETIYDEIKQHFGVDNERTN